MPTMNPDAQKSRTPGATGARPHSENAGKRPWNDSRTAETCLIQYQPPKGRVLNIRLSAPQLEMLQALRPAPVSRIGLANRRPRLGLSGPQYIERLRRKGLEIESVWHTGTDRDGRRVRFVEYILRGTVLKGVPDA